MGGKKTDWSASATNLDKFIAEESGDDDSDANMSQQDSIQESIHTDHDDSFFTDEDYSINERDMEGT